MRQMIVEMKGAFNKVVKIRTHVFVSPISYFNVYWNVKTTKTDRLNTFIEMYLNLNVQFSMHILMNNFEPIFDLLIEF